MPKVPYEVNSKLGTGNGSLSNRSLLPSLTVSIASQVGSFQSNISSNLQNIFIEYRY